MTRLRSPRVLAAVVLVVAGVLAGCGSDPGPGASPSVAPEERSAASSPFAVDAPPEGFTLVAAGLGTRTQAWGSDTVGTDPPTTIVRRTGDDALVQLRSQSTYDLYGEGWQRTDGFDLHGDGISEVDVGGRRGFLFEPVPAGDEGRPAGPPRLAVVWGDDLVLDVRGEASADELVALAAGARVPEDHAEAPMVDEVPEGFELVGRASADAALAVRAGVDVGRDEVPGTGRAHGAGWVADPADQGATVSVLTLRGSGNDVAAIAAGAGLDRARDDRVAVEADEIDGRPAARIEWFAADGAGGEWLGRRTVVADAAWGDLLVVNGTAPQAGASALPSFEDLLAVAASVRPTDDAAWEALVVEARGGPGLHPDPGRTELARGMAGDVPWLLQTGGPGPDPYAGEDQDGSVRPDWCLKVEVGERPCPRESFGTDDSEVRHYGIDRHPITVVVWNRAAAAFRVTPVGGEPFDVAATPVPGGKVWVAAVDRDLATPSCAPTRPGQHRVEALDASGAVIGCVNGL